MDDREDPSEVIRREALASGTQDPKTGSKTERCRIYPEKARDISYESDRPRTKDGGMYLEEKTRETNQNGTHAEANKEI